ncbi:MAG: glycerol-3-phosphate acyltransferase [Candidatus Thorarchaeota archaeon]
MDAFILLMSIISVFIGYIIGTINPGYFFGRLKKIDIREVGTRNAGTSNVYKILGIAYAVPTAIYDTLKGLLSMFIAYLLGADYVFIQISGLVAILGHIFPFYLRFRGGQGMATSTGILLYYLVNYFTYSIEILFILLFLLIIVAIFGYVTKVGEIIGIMVIPILAYALFIYYPEVPYTIYLTIILAYIVFIGLYNTITKKKMVIEDETFKLHWWRTATRPFAVLFILFYVFLSKGIAITIIGIVGLCFIILDITRFIHKQTNLLITTKVKAFFRKGEEKKFSSMTLFLVAAFITMLLFDESIAITALIFLIFGDIFSKIFGLAFGRHTIFEKTLEGTLAYYGAVLITGFFLFTTLHIHPAILIIGGISAPLVELFSFQLNDNFTVSLICGTIMTVGTFFGVPKTL